VPSSERPPIRRRGAPIQPPPSPSQIHAALTAVIRTLPHGVGDVEDACYEVIADAWGALAEGKDAAGGPPATPPAPAVPALPPPAAAGEGGGGEGGGGGGGGEAGGGGGKGTGGDGAGDAAAPAAPAAPAPPAVGSPVISPARSASPAPGCSPGHAPGPAASVADDLALMEHLLASFEAAPQQTPGVLLEPVGGWRGVERGAAWSPRVPGRPHETLSQPAAARPSRTGTQRFSKSPPRPTPNPPDEL
jgi:hypothetical protein